jgi:cation diffusion facilitator family transporter
VEFALNLTIAAIKLVIGGLARNLTIVSDAFHGLTDAANNVIGWVGVRLSHRPPDRDHPYGHRKIEALLALGIGVVMVLASWEIVRRVIGRVFIEDAPDPAPFDPLFAGALAATFFANLFVSRWEMRVGRRHQSAFLIADATHTRTHMAMDLLAIVSLSFSSRMPWLDSVLALVVVGYLLRSGWIILRENTNILIDATRLDPEPVRRVVEAVPGVANSHAVRSHGMPDEIYLDLHIVIDPRLTAREAQRIEDDVRQAIFDNFPQVVEVSIHHQTQPRESDAPQPVRRADGGEA